MRLPRQLFATILVPLLYVVPAATGLSQQYDTKLFAEMRWRSIGPHRGGRTKAITGVASQPNVFYVGVCNGGLWRTTDYGRTWRPIFDDRIDRRRRRGALGPERHLRRKRRGAAAARSLHRRRHLQVDRRGQELGAS